MEPARRVGHLRRPAHPALVSEADFVVAQAVGAARGPAPAGDPVAPHARRYLLAGLHTCGTCSRKMESAWSHGKAAYRCRHGHTAATAPDQGRARNAYVREDRILAQLPALHLLLTGGQPARRRRTCRGADTRPLACPQEVLGYLREQEITLTWDQAAGALSAQAAAASITVKAS